MATKEQIQDFREAVHGVAADLNCTTEHAFEVIFTPEWVWDEMVDARDAVAPDQRPLFDLLADDTPERQAAADRYWSALKAAVT